MVEVHTYVHVSFVVLVGRRWLPFGSPQLELSSSTRPVHSFYFSTRTWFIRRNVSSSVPADTFAIAEVTELIVVLCCSAHVSRCHSSRLKGPIPSLLDEGKNDWLCRKHDLDYVRTYRNFSVGNVCTLICPFAVFRCRRASREHDGGFPTVSSEQCSFSNDDGDGVECLPLLLSL